MSEAEVPVAMGLFGQISSNLARSYTGTGLGLPLTKMLMEIHDGTLNITSAPGEGTVVKLILPPDCVKGHHTE